MSEPALIDPSNPIFNDEEKAREYLEALRWPDGPVCPHCNAEKSATKLQGKSTRPGVYKCRKCEHPYTATVGTVFESSKIPLRTWLYVTFLLCSSKKGISSHQIHRMIGVQYKTARFMTMRIREAMRTGSLVPPMGGPGSIVEIDETYIGKKPEAKNFSKPHGASQKMAVLTLVNRGGEARSFHIDYSDSQTIVPIVQANIDRETKIATDEARYYNKLKKHFIEHGTVNHSAYEWKRGEVSTNVVEGFFSIFKRGMKGVYQHCSEANLHRYLAEFDFRYSNRIALGIDDDARAEKALKGIVGKRLLYKKSHVEKATCA
jgi:transposase-like protein